MSNPTGSPVPGEPPVFAERPTEFIIKDAFVLGALPLALAGFAGIAGIPQLGFVLLALFRGFGFALYAVLWFVLPDQPGGRNGLDRLLDAFRALFDQRRTAAAPRNTGPGTKDAYAGEPTSGCAPTRT